MSNFTARAYTGFFFVLITAFGVWFSHWSFLAVILIINVFCLLEFFNLSQLKGFSPLRWYGVFLGTIAVFSTAFISWKGYDPFILMFLLPFLFLIFVFELYRKKESPLLNVSILLGGIIFVSLPLQLLMIASFAQGDYKWEIVMANLVFIWSNDTFAYLVGSRFGKNKLFPRISPKKSWEGAFGGLIFTIGVIFIWAHFFSIFSFWQWLFGGLIIIVMGSLGDLIESMFKRYIGVKDSGNLLPGHGGFLDRFDAFLFSLPFYSAYVIFLFRM